MLLKNHKKEKIHLQYFLKKFMDNWTCVIRTHDIQGTSALPLVTQVTRGIGQ